MNELPPPPPRWLDYLRLLRAPNVFTAIADVLMGVVAVQETFGPIPTVVLLAAASTCLYSAGIVLNDVFDIEVDRQERPERPLPSGRISLATARNLGFLLLLVGVSCGALAGYITQTPASLPWRSGAVAVVLAGLIIAYDSGAKKTVVGPLCMGGCRFLNVLLGMSLGAVAAEPLILGYGVWQLLLAGSIGIYIVGVTCFARGEAATSPRGPLVLGLALIAAGLSLLAIFPRFLPPGRPIHFRVDTVWPMALLLLALPIIRRCVLAIVDPASQRVQFAVKHAILSLIMLDGAAAFLLGDALAAAVILVLLLPAVLLGRWVYST